jgi:transglutaminase-like putative cysteine protease
MVNQKPHTAAWLTLAAWVVTGMLADFIAPAVTGAALLVGGGIAVLVFLAFYLTAGKQRIAPATIITTVIFSAVYLAGLEKTGLFLGDYFRHFSLLMAGEECPLPFQILNMCLAAFVMLPLLLLALRSLALRLAAAGGLLLYLLVGLFMRLTYEKITVCLCLLFIVFALTELTQEARWRERVAVYLLPLLVLYFFVLLIIPAREQPYNWQFVRSIVASVREAVSNISQRFGEGRGGDEEGFGLQVAGFSGQANVGTGVGTSEREVMQIELTRGRRMQVYLTGNVFDTFDGEKWTVAVSPEEHGHGLDLLETIYAVKRHDGDNVGDYLYNARLGVGYTGLRSGYLFAPLKVQSILTGGAWRKDLREGSGQWLFTERMGRGTAYTMSFYQLNLGQEYFSEMVMAQMGYAYESEMPEEIAEQYYVLLYDLLPLEMYSEAVLAAHSERIIAAYSKGYPLSEEVRAFLAEITLGAGNGYEIARAIERTLAGQGEIAFTYTKSPELLPEGKSFPDYFLLESHSGYCSYYATAFVLMAREMGLPARYVQGYYVADRNLGVEVVSVTDNMAHAWPEVYFRGVGWIPFEPTPGFGGGRYRYWSPQSTEATGTAVYEPPWQREGQEGEDSEQPALTDSGGEVTSLAAGISRLLKTVLVIILSFVAVGVALTVFYRFWKWWNYRHYTLAERFLAQVSVNLYILGLMGYRFRAGETLAEFALRVRSHEEGLLLRFVVPLELLAYRGDEVAADTLDLAFADRVEMYGLVRQRGWRCYCWVRFRVLMAG